MQQSQWGNWNNKFHAEKTVIDGIIFDSKAEALHYCELRAMERAGKIFQLERQVKFNLIPSEEDSTGHRQREINYFADFVYFDENMKRHVEDVKGVKTPVYNLKKRLMWHVHHILIEEV